MSEARIEIFRSPDKHQVPFLTLITPCYKRPEALKRNYESIQAQTYKDIEQIRVIDDVGRGWAWVARELAEATRLARGEYVMGLDDDDELYGSDVVQSLSDAVDVLDMRPEVIIVKCEIQYSFGPRVIVPEPEYWGALPVKGHISGQCVIVRRDIRMRHLADFRADDDGMVIDFPWMQAVLRPENNYRVLWLPITVSRMQFRGMGRTEAEMASARQPVAAQP